MGTSYKELNLAADVNLCFPLCRVPFGKREQHDGLVTDLCTWGCRFEYLCFLLFATLGKTLATPCKTATGWRLRTAHLVWSV